MLFIIQNNIRLISRIMTIKCSLYGCSWGFPCHSTKHIPIFSYQWLNKDIYVSMKHQHTDFLTHWGRVTHIYLGILTIIGSDNGLFPGWGQAIIWTNAGLLLIGPLGTNFSEISIEIYTFSFKKMHLKMLSAKCCLINLYLDVLILEQKHL